MHKLDAERARRAALDPAAAKAEAETFSSLHDATVYDHPPLLPVDEVVFDPMHAMHTEANVLLDESVHQFLVIDAENPAIAAEQKVVMADVNATCGNRRTSLSSSSLGRTTRVRTRTR